MAKLDPNSPCLDTFCDTPPNTVDDEEDHGSTCPCCENESKGESKSDTVMGDATSDGAREDVSQEATLLQGYIDQLIKANPKAHTATLRLENIVCGWFICPPGLVHTLSSTNSAIFLTSVLKTPKGGHFLLAMGKDNNGFELYLAWAFVKFENPEVWNWFLANLNRALHMVSAGFVRFGIGPAAFTTDKLSRIRQPLSQQFGDCNLRTSAKPTFSIQTNGDTLVVLSRIWNRVAWERDSQGYKIIDCMKLSGRGAGLTPYGQTRMDYFRKIPGFEFRSIGWDQEKCNGSAKILDLAESQILDIRLQIRDDYGMTSCTCSGDVEPEGHCHHALIAVANLMNYGLNAAKFTPYNIQNWFQCYFASTDRMESPFDY